MKRIFFTIVFFLVFFLLSIDLSAKKSVKLIPQRIIFFESNKDNNQYQTYINYLINTTCESLDSNLDIRYMKKEEYDKYQYLLSDMTTDSLRKFYSNTNVRGIVTASIKENINSMAILLSLYQLYNDKVIVKDIEIKKENFYNEIESFPSFLIKLIKETFPKIEPKVMTKDKIRLVKLIRDAPDYALNIWGGSGYQGINLYAYFRVEDPFSSNERYGEKTSTIQGISIDFGIDGKVKRFFVGLTLNFTLYIAQGGYTSIISTQLSEENKFFFEFVSNSDFGVYFVGDLLRLSFEYDIGVSPLYSFSSDFADPYTTTELSENIFFGLNMYFLLGITIKPLPAIEFSIYAGPGMQWIRYDVPYIGVYAKVKVKTRFNLTKKIYLLFDFLISLSTGSDYPLTKDDYDHWNSERIENKYSTSNTLSSITLGLGYKFEKRIKK